MQGSKLKLAMILKLQKLKKQQEEKMIRAIEMQKVKKEIYLLEQNLILFDELDHLKNPKYFLEREQKSKELVQKHVKYAAEREKAEEEFERLMKKKTFLPFSKTFKALTLTMKQKLANQL
jgi:hypothetical protein